MLRHSESIVHLETMCINRVLQMDVQTGLTDLAEDLVNTMPAETRCLDLPI